MNSGNFPHHKFSTSALVLSYCCKKRGNSGTVFRQPALLKIELKETKLNCCIIMDELVNSAKKTKKKLSFLERVTSSGVE